MTIIKEGKFDTKEECKGYADGFGDGAGKYGGSGAYAMTIDEYGDLLEEIEEMDDKCYCISEHDMELISNELGRIEGET